MAACLSNITEISREECIGNSLPIINDNFTNMKNYVCSLETGQQGIIQQLQFLIPLYGIINFYGVIVLGGVNFELDGKGKQNIVQGIDLRAYHLCNGNNGTPDLRDRFVVGSGGSYPHRAFGPLHNSTASLAFSSVKLTIPEMPTHKHTITDPGHFHTITDPGHGHTGSADSTGSEHEHDLGNIISNDDSDSDCRLKEGAADGCDCLHLWTKTDGAHSHTVTVTDNSTGITKTGTPQGAAELTGITQTNDEGLNDFHENRPPYMALAYIMRYI